MPSIVPMTSFASVKRFIVVLFVIAGIVTASLTMFENPVIARAAAVAGVCLILWLSEVVPPFVPTLFLWSIVPLVLGNFDQEFRFARVLGWSADPVLALFLGGFTLSAAASRHGIDRELARYAVQWSGGRRLLLLAFITGTTAVLSMWMSNIAAAAMMIAALRPLLAEGAKDDSFRRAMLMCIALGANFGGIATPIGTGPNAIAIAAVSESHAITFLAWMGFALPLTIGLIVAGFILITMRFRVRGTASLTAVEHQKVSPAAYAVVVVFALTVVAWLTEPLHGAPSAIVALLACVALFGSGLLGREDLARIDWSTLILIAGGIGLGNLLEQSGLVRMVAASLPLSQVPHSVLIFTLCFASALLSALMSNTATATMLIPLAMSFDGSPATTILVAVSASLGIMFVISTPPNAMVYGEGGLKPSDLLVSGLVLMVVGCLLVSLTGSFVLRMMGIP